MSAAGLPPEDLRFELVKRLDPSLSLKNNRSQVEIIFNQLKSAFKRGELVGDSFITVQLADARTRLLSVVSNTREGLSESEQEKYLFYSDFAALLLDIAKLFKASSKKQEFTQYATTEKQLKEWAHEAGAPYESISEFAVWQHRYELQTLLDKLAASFKDFSVDEEVETEVEDEETEAEKDVAQEDDEKKRKLIAEALEKQQEDVAAAAAALSSAVVPTTTDGGAALASASATPPPVSIDPSKPLGSQLTAKQLSQYNANIGWLTSFTLLQIADEMGLEISTLPPDLRGELTGMVATYLTTEGDLAELLKGSPTARLRAIRGFQKYLQQNNFYDKHQLYPSATSTLEERTDKRINEILGDTNSIIDTSIRKTVEDIVLVHGQKSQKLIDSFDNAKIELIFGLDRYKITIEQADKLKGVLKSYAEVRLDELVLHTGDEDTLEGLDPDQNPELKDVTTLVDQIKAVRTTIQQNTTSADSEKAELGAGALTSKGGVSKKIKLAVEQNQKIFGPYWSSLSPEQQAVVLSTLDPSYKNLLEVRQHPVEGYPLPLTIAEFNPDILRRFELEQSMLKNGKMSPEEYQLALEIAQYNDLVEQQEAVAAQLRQEYLALTSAEQQAAIATSLALENLAQMQEQASFMEMCQQDEALCAAGGGESVDSEAINEPSNVGDGSPVDNGRSLIKRRRGKKGEGVSPKEKRIKALKNAASKKAHAAVNSGLTKAAGAIPVVGTAAAAVLTALSAVIGKENANKLVAGVGVAAGLVFAKTLYAFTTIGGALGGAIGGIVGSILAPGAGTLIGAVLGANIGAAIAPASWMGVFSGGGGGLFSSTVFPTVGSVASTATNAAGTVVSGASSAASTVAQATQATTTAGSATTAATIKATGLNVITATTSLTFLAPVGGVVLAGSFTLVVLIVIFAAFLVPMPFSSYSGGANQTESLYATVEKTSNPSSLSNNTPTQVTYTISIAPRTGYQIEIKGVTDSFSNVGGTGSVPTSPLVRDNFPTGVLSQPTTTTYTIELSGEDILVSNTVTFVIDVFNPSGELIKQGESISSIASVRIGNPPIGCFEFAPAGERITYTTNGQSYTNISETITQTDQNLFLQSFTRRVATNAMYISLLCSDGPILIHKWQASPSGYYAWVFAPNKIGFYAPAWSSGRWFEYTLIHETGHIIDARNGGLRTQFLQVKTDASCYSYPATCSEGESFAEGMVLYVLYQTLSFNFSNWTGPFPFKSDYPVEYNWYKQNIFGGQEF